MSVRSFLGAALFVVAADAFAVTEQEAIQAQVAAAMASADYAARKCPNLRVDQERLGEQVQRSGKSADELKASEDYAEQRDVIAEMEKHQQAALICVVLPKAHGGYGRGILVSK